MRRRSNKRQEREVTDRIFLKEACKRELKQWLRLVKAKDFTTSLEKQNEASLIARGIDIKIQALRAQSGDDKELIEMVQACAREYGHVWNKKSVNLLVSAPDGGPVKHDVSVKGQMNIGALQEAIRKDQEER